MFCLFLPFLNKIVEGRRFSLAIIDNIKFAVVISYVVHAITG